MADRSSNPNLTEFYTGKLFDLELSRTARAFEPIERIWDRELRRMFGLINGHADALRSWDQSAAGRGSTDPLAGPLLSIAVFGTYGSGKSSLLKTFVREARSHQGRADINKPEKLEIHSLPVIEPNLRSTDDHFLYSFLAHALEEDLKRNQHEQERAEAGSHTLSPVQQAFEKVSEYLQVIDKQPRERTYDPLGLSLERLDRHTSDFRLSEALHDLIDVLADNLAGRKPSSVLILPVDDPDMSLDKLRVTLETYRRYLLHPRLVPVFTFTGRLAEELLQVHFATEVKESERTSMAKERTVGGSRQIEHLKITEHLAVQYLVKLFPIRNRILVGYAPARVQAARFQTAQTAQLDAGEGSSERPGVPVIHLLEVASLLLFGHPQWPIVPRVRMALRPATLRRQLQVLDALHDAGVQHFLDGETGEVCVRKLKPGGAGGGAATGDGVADLTWTRIFTTAAWSLLNVHRDVLRELDLHIEELSSWTPRGLRREILRIILAQESDKRNVLIKRWRHRIEDRRGQILSLLAVTVFRPEMPGDELSGENPDRVRQFVWAKDERARRVATTLGGSGDAGEERSEETATFPDRPLTGYFTALRGTLWFLELWFGFYLPQILFRGSRKEDGDHGEADAEESLISVGWNLKAGAAQAISEATSRNEVSTVGMMLLDPIEFRSVLDDIHDDSDEDPSFYPGRLFIDLWCFYGYRSGKAWAGVSLWRGLGLLGQVLDDYQRLRGGASKEALDAEHERDLAAYNARPKEERENLAPPLHPHTQRIVALLRDHLDGALRPGTFRATDEVFYTTVRWQSNADAQSALHRLAKWLHVWAESFENLYLDPLPNHCEEQGPPNQKLIKTWERSFIRRLHGEYVLGELWPRMGGTFFEKPETSDEGKVGNGVGDLNAHVAIQRWKDVLKSYFEGVHCYRREAPHDLVHTLTKGKTLKRVLIEECPLFAPWHDPPDASDRPTAQAAKAFWDKLEGDKLEELFRRFGRAPDRLTKEAKEQRERERGG